MAKKKKPGPAVVPVEVGESVESKEPLERITYHLPPELAERVRDVAWWDRRTANDIVRAALEQYLAALEKKRKEPYPPRGGVLRRGRFLT